MQLALSVTRSYSRSLRLVKVNMPSWIAMEKFIAETAVDSERRLLEDRFRKLTRRHSDSGIFVFEMIAHPMIFLEGNRILCRVHAQFFEPFRIHVEAPRAILHD